MNAHPPPTASRRRFFALATGTCAALMTQCSRQHGLHRVSRSAKALGTTVTMTALHADESKAATALDAAFAELEHIESVMSIYRPESQLSRLNREGVLGSPDPLLVEVLRYSNEMSKRSDGAFDITVQPLWRLKGARPDTATMSLVDWSKVKVDAQSIQLAPGMAITLNGIAQGFAADVSMRVMHAHGVEHALIDAGEFSARGMNAEKAPWRIGIQHPREPDAYAALTQLENRCLATSGDYETSFSADFSRHHILDPRTGQSPGELASVSVLASTAMAADALSTALFVLGSQRGMELLQNYPGTDALLILKDGRHLATPGFPFAA
ncbi:FAD:protein FMN transferase [Brevifollis gellanilyticus]|uniref:FAD:protein FMN transferase n=1 Tax=Brevifollis gellanilyticus TaxID=748831 RepID=A0A512M4V6_9BACT|nr:FAD:protein FMN transferase [Brevifollis gellanilyticus]GEP41764.1 FAD:protein FMN transferase [Brevifollis gellanilyticus]